MNGSPDFRPEPGHRASDPSLEEMLRRARDARLGDETDYDRPAPPAHMPPPGDWRDGRLWGWVLFAAGVLAGVLLSICVASVAATVSSWTAPVALSTPPSTGTAIPATPSSTPTPFPTVTPTATPLPTATPTATPFPTTTAVVIAPPTTDEIVTLAQTFYDTQGPYVGSYVLLDVTGLQIQSEDETQLAVCISYEAASIEAPDTAALSNTRLFTLAADSDGSWQVVAMGGNDSCNLTEP